jgi:carbamate kinase
MRIAVALGGNALLERGETPDSDIQESHITHAVAALSPLLHDHDLVITHGNGPQVGILAIESAGDPALSRPYPLDVLGAQTQGMIGYWLVQALQNAAAGKPAAGLICRTLVKADDPAFGDPTKFVGPVYDKPTALALAADHGWDVRQDGQAWRRVVPSPEPEQIVELDTIRLLMSTGVIVVCAGGGGIPVVPDGTGGLRGVEAVVDKDLTAALLAQAVGADALLLLTDVEAVVDEYGTPAGPAHPPDDDPRAASPIVPGRLDGPER